MKITQLEILYLAHEHVFNEFMKYSDEYENSNYKDSWAKIFMDLNLDKMHDISELIKAELNK